MSGLSLLPKIPAMWESVAGLFGKKVPASIAEAGKLAGELVGSFKAGEVPPEKQVELKAIFYEHEEEMARIKLQEKEAELGELQHQRDTQVALWANEQKSASIFVQETRPKILRDMWKFCQAFIILSLLAVFGCLILKVTIDNIKMLIDVIKYMGGFLFGTFGAAFLGYSAARTIDKRNPNAKNGDDLMGKMLSKML